MAPWHLRSFTEQVAGTSNLFLLVWLSRLTSESTSTDSSIKVIPLTSPKVHLKKPPPPTARNPLPISGPHLPVRRVESTPASRPSALARSAGDDRGADRGPSRTAGGASGGVRGQRPEAAGAGHRLGEAAHLSVSVGRLDDRSRPDREQQRFNVKKMVTHHPCPDSPEGTIQFDLANPQDARLHGQIKLELWQKWSLGFEPGIVQGHHFVSLHVPGSPRPSWI